MTAKGFTVSHLRDGKFERGLRSYLEYRYLDIDKATDGRVVAWHLRAVPGAPFTGGEPHVHRTTFQMVYVLKGWIEFEYEEKGLVRLVALDQQFRAQHPGHRPTCVRSSFEADGGARLKNNDALRAGGLAKHNGKAPSVEFDPEECLSSDRARARMRSTGVSTAFRATGFFLRKLEIREGGFVMKRLIRSYVGLLVAAFVLAGLAAQPAMAQEKAKEAKAAKAEKGKSTTKVLFENDKVRVFEVTYKPGDASPNVARPARVIRTLKGGTLESTYADGKKEKRETKAGEVIFREASTPYTPKNIGKTQIVLYVVYLKEPKK